MIAHLANRVSAALFEIGKVEPVEFEWETKDKTGKVKVLTAIFAIEGHTVEVEFEKVSKPESFPTSYKFSPKINWYYVAFFVDKQVSHPKSKGIILSATNLRILLHTVVAACKEFLEKKSKNAALYWSAMDANRAKSMRKDKVYTRLVLLAMRVFKRHKQYTIIHNPTDKYGTLHMSAIVPKKLID